MDGCLVNFEKGVRTLLKTGSSDLEKRTMWEGISRAPRWFEQLEWQMDGRRLWNAIKHLNPDILTGVPEIKSSRVEKFNWCKRELGLEEADAHHVDMAAYGADGLDDHQSVNGNFPRDDKTNIITCWSNVLPKRFAITVCQFYNDLQDAYSMCHSNLLQYCANTSCRLLSVSQKTAACC